ncbi:glycosyltransferase [Collinsella sp. HCP3S3_D1]|uniref:glycosyltransferase n=1 Tax=Collinsella sp. HCP3S3_D1 TaxID=3438934 RepID=UPI003F8B74D1
MRYVQLNAYGNAWAESIIFKKHRELIANGDDSWVFWARTDHEQDDHMVKVASYPEICLDVLQTRLDGRAGFHSKGITRRLLRRLDEIDPDVVHLHVLCGYWINVEMLFEWLASHRCKVVWTLHDCWAFTGHCIHFTKVKCMQWKTHCIYDGQNCPQKREYPETYAGDESVSWCFEQKKRLFTMLPADRMELVTPSQWLADLVAESFLSKYPVRVVHNTINTEIFKPTPSDFRERHGLTGKFVVLGAASKWSERKGLDDFVRLAGELDDRFAVVLVGLSEKQIKELPEQMTRLPKTDSLRELAEAYTAADLFLTTSQEETYGMTVAEAAACGTPVAVVDGTACMEASENAERYLIAPDLSNLVTTICAVYRAHHDKPGVEKTFSASGFDH